MHRNSLAVVEAAPRLALQFAVCDEDQTIPKLVEAGKVAAADRVRRKN